jgi:sulfite exporter TauE/SafE/copper chaperone CopZ
MEKIIYISGMHCPSCDILIREIIHDTEGIELVEFTSTWVLTFRYDTDASSTTLKEAISASWYKVSDSIASTRKVNRKEMSVLIVSGLLFWWILSTFDITQYAATLWTTGTLGYGEMFLLWIIASLSTCLALVGGFVLMRWSLQWWSKESFRDAWYHQLLFQAGRLSGYAVWWALLWFLWSALIFSPSVNGGINLVVSLLLLVMWRNMLDLFALKIPTWWGWDRFMDLLKNFAQKKRWGIIAGALTFFLPCGFTQVAQINAMSTGDVWQWALLLFTFALGTLPVLLILWLTGNRFQSKQLGVGYKVLWVFLVVLSLFLIQNSFLLLGR